MPFTSLLSWTPLVLVAVALVVARRVSWLGGRDVTSGPPSPLAPLLAGLVSALVPCWLWASLDPVPVIHDEAAYLLQARMFAMGRWTSPAPPLPEFFEQFHVFVTPVLAAKYPPGHALLLVPGIWLGVPALVPLVLSGLTGALLYALARRFSNDVVAALAVGLWIVAEVNLRFRATFFSEVTTGFLWLAGWWLLLRYRDTGRRSWLAALAAIVAWGGITRPLTMLVFAATAAVVALRLVARQRRWSDITVALPAGLVILAIEPIWNHAVLGDWLTTPYARYAETYLPIDVPGFGLHDAKPLRALPASMTGLDAYVRPQHEAHTVRALPKTSWDRFSHLAEDSWGSRTYLLVFAAVGLCVMPLPVAVAAATALLLVLAHLIYAYPAEWSVYYLELQPVIAFLTALGVWQVAAMTAPGRARRVTPALQLTNGALLVIGVLVLCNLPPALLSATESRRTKHQMRSYQEVFRDMVRRIPDPRAVVFVRYAPQHSVHLSLIENAPDPASARVWIVHDRGADNARLLRVAPDRTPYLYEERSVGGRREMRIQRLELPPASAPVPPAP